ncbi:hypothetical protein T11_7754 [Trichinella zimbabwensis]|uniref:Uncharacterized protein n=1 Tax=Trichinella zimbabwensis TaxID=268475 RepID=A0A0V1I6F1_9BILA|nr:hypothetical protein T11_7754 [Trichinella zimbabwensis]
MTIFFNFLNNLFVDLNLSRTENAEKYPKLVQSQVAVQLFLVTLNVEWCKKLIIQSYNGN